MFKYSRAAMCFVYCNKRRRKITTYKTQLFENQKNNGIVPNKTPAKHRDIFRDTHIAKKYGEGEDRTLDPLAGKAISEVHFTPWSGDKVEFWQNL